MKTRILAHGDRKVPPFRSNGDARLVRKIGAHVERHIGPVEDVFHDLVADVVTIDLLWVRADAHRNYHTFVTCGMSERPMPAPEARCDCRFAELLLRLPANWPIGPRALPSDRLMWPLQELEQLARTPHLYRTHLWGGHTIANGGTDGSLRPLCAETRFCGSLLAVPSWTPPGFRRLRVDRRRKLEFFSVVPLYEEELVLARDNGTPILIEHLAHTHVTDLLDPARPNPLAVRN